MEKSLLNELDQLQKENIITNNEKEVEVKEEPVNRENENNKDFELEIENSDDKKLVYKIYWNYESKSIIILNPYTKNRFSVNSDLNNVVDPIIIENVTEETFSDSFNAAIKYIKKIFIEDIIYQAAYENNLEEFFPQFLSNNDMQSVYDKNSYIFYKTFGKEEIKDLINSKIETVKKIYQVKEKIKNIEEEYKDSDIDFLSLFQALFLNHT